MFREECAGGCIFLVPRPLGKGQKGICGLEFRIKGIRVLQKLGRDPRGVWHSGLFAFIPIKLIIAGLLCVLHGHRLFAA